MRLFIFLISVFVAVPSFGQDWAQEVLDQYKDSIRTYGVVALVDNGQDVLTASIGVSHSDVPISPNSRFCIGSCTKMYTATIALKLQEEGMLELDDSLYRFIADHPFIDRSITIRQLLNHSSGIADFSKSDFVNKALLEPYEDYSDSLILSKLDKVEFCKGERYQYSNTNYLLLRKIIEACYGQSYESAFEYYIIEPLGLENTFPFYSNEIIDLANPIIDAQNLQSISKLGLNAISRGIGNAVSDVYDVNKFIRALLIDQSILNEESLQLMTDFYTFNGHKVGLGLFSENFGGRRVWGHTGRQISYISYAFVEPSTGHSFVLVNNNANDPYIDQIINEFCTEKSIDHSLSKEK